MFGFPVYVRAVSAAYDKFPSFLSIDRAYFIRAGYFTHKQKLRVLFQVFASAFLVRAILRKKDVPLARTLRTVDRFRRRRSRRWKRSTRRIHENCDDEHINENIIRNQSDEYWYSNVSKKTLRERFSFLFINTNYPTVFFVGDVWAQRKYRANSQFDFYCIPLSSVIDHFPDFSFSLLYAFLRVSSSFHPVSFYTITHAFTRAPSCRGLEKYVSRTNFVVANRSLLSIS